MNAIIVFPNTSNFPWICTAAPILSGILKRSGWDVDYFDTYKYEKIIDSTEEKETTGGFKTDPLLRKRKKSLPAKNIIPDL